MSGHPDPADNESRPAGQTELKPADAESAAPAAGTPPAPSSSVERMFPFVLRARILLVGRESLQHNKRKLHFVLITKDLSANSRKRIMEDFAYYPIVEVFTSEDLERFFSIRGAKVIGFQKSGLAQSIYAELKPHRVNKPPLSPGSTSKKPAAPESP